MSDIISTIKKLPEMEDTIPADSTSIRSAEVQLNVCFADDYKEYLSVFGQVCSKAIAISGLNGDNDCDVVELTLEARSVNEQIPFNFYVIEDVGVDGLIIWQDETCALYQSIPMRSPEKIHHNLYEYLQYVIEGYEG